MKRASLLFVALFAFIASHAQSMVVFKPDWKVGDKRTATITNEEAEYKNGVLKDKFSNTYVAKYEVKSEDANTFTVKITMDNIMLTSAVKVYEKIGEELNDYKDLELVYQVSKMVGTAELINWKEAQAFVLETFNEIEKVIIKNEPELEDYMKLALKPIVSMFDSKENIAAYMGDEIEMIIQPYSHTFTLNDTLRVEKTEANPFNPAEQVSAVELFYLTEMDSKKGLFALDYSLQLDISEFVAMMKEMMKEMGKSFGVSDTSINKKNAEWDEMTFDVTNSSRCVFDANTSWPISIIATAEIIGSDPKGQNRKEIKKTVIFQ